MAEIFRSTLDTFREMSTTPSRRIYFREGDQDGRHQLTTRHVSFAGRLVEWAKAKIGLKNLTGEQLRLQEASKEAHNQLLGTIQQHYGSQVVQSTRDSIIEHRDSNKPLTGSFVSQVLQSAGKEKASVARINLETYQRLRREVVRLPGQFGGTNAKATFFRLEARKVLGKEVYDQLSEKKLQKVDAYIQKKLLYNPLYKNKKLSDVEIKTLVREGFKWLRTHGGEDGTSLKSKRETSSPLSDIDIAQLAKVENGSEGQRELRNQFLNLFNSSNQLLASSNEVLEKTPANSAELRTWEQKAGHIESRLDAAMEFAKKIQNQVQTSPEAYDGEILEASQALQKELTRARGGIAKARTYNASFIEEHPLNSQAVQSAAGTWLKAAREELKIYKVELQKLKSDGQTIDKKLRVAIGKAEQRLDEADRQLAAKFPAQTTLIERGEVKKIERDSLAAALKIIRATNKTFAQDKLFGHAFNVPNSSQASKVRLKGQRERLLKEENFRGGERSVQLEFQIGDKKVKVEDKTLLGKAIFEGTNTEATYKEDGKLVAGPDELQSRHLPNLATTELSDTTNGKVFLSATRHAVVATDEKDPSISKQILENKAKELIQASLTSNPEAARSALAANRTGRAMELPLVSVSLLTPAKLPGMKDRDMLADQLSAFRGLEKGKPVELEIPNPEGAGNVRVVVKPRFVPFNFGVDPKAVRYRMGWKQVAGMNERSMKKLLGDLKTKGPPGGMTGEALIDGNIPAEERQQINELATQIKDIWQNNSYKKNDGDVYKLQARIALLSYKIGALPLWNCQSGKGRSAHMDAEVKALATRAHFRGDLPQAGDLGDGSKNMLREFALKGPNHWIQANSTGYGGYETSDALSGVERAVTENPALKSAWRGGHAVAAS